MKKIFLSTGFFLLVAFSSKALDASITFATFKSPSQNYVEIYLHMVGATVTYVPNADSTAAQATVEVVILFKQDGTIVKFDKYQLNGPWSNTEENFVDLKRFVLPNGNYDLEVSVQDMNKAENAIRHEGKFKMDFPTKADKLLQSDIQLLASIKPSEKDHVLTKNGFHLEPLAYNFYSRNFSKLIFYNEIYETDKKIGDDFQVSYGIEK
ncbi:MAG: hypothetical protein AAF573_14115, partial [Bacteroidota bacterium]